MCFFYNGSRKYAAGSLLHGKALQGRKGKKASRNFAENMRGQKLKDKNLRQLYFIKEEAVPRTMNVFKENLTVHIQ